MLFAAFDLRHTPLQNTPLKPHPYKTVWEDAFSSTDEFVRCKLTLLGAEIWPASCEPSQTSRDNRHDQNLHYRGTRTQGE